MRISDWSSDVCSSDLHEGGPGRFHRGRVGPVEQIDELDLALMLAAPDRAHREAVARHDAQRMILEPVVEHALVGARDFVDAQVLERGGGGRGRGGGGGREGKQTGRASCGASVCQDEWSSEVAATYKKTTQ